jgi:nucleotide-binding universal stress UspA family protein
MKARTKGRIVEGDAGKVICREAERLKPAAVIMGTRGRTLFQRCLSLYKFHTYIR